MTRRTARRPRLLAGLERLDDRITPDVGDTLATALNTGLTGPGVYGLAEPIGDGASTTKDVDLYALSVPAGGRLTVLTTPAPFAGTAMNTYVRVFTAAGTQVTANDDFAGGNYSRLTVTLAAAGSYFVGVSGSNNSGYNPTTAGSGVAGSTGTYHVSIRVEAAVSWTGQGGVIRNGQTEGLTAQSNPVAGAVQALAPHPTNPDILYVGAVNGGVWKTTNATNSSPTWTPLTDFQTSLSMAALEFDPTDASFNTLYAGHGRVSSLSSIGGAQAGLLRTTDGGATWTPLTPAGTGLPTDNVRGIAPRGTVVTVATRTNGVYRSTNTGATFSKISGTAGTGLPTGGTFDLASDRGDPNRLYVATTAGLYRSVDGGATWVSVTPAGAGLSASTSNAKLSVHHAVGAGTNAVYLGVVNSGVLSGVFRSPDQGGNWTAMSVPATPDQSGKSVSAATNASPIAVTSTSHGLSTGSLVSISGARGNTAANGPWTVTVTGANTFTLNGSVGNGTYGGGGLWVPAFAITNATNASPITVTAPAHGLTGSLPLQIAGVQGNTAANGFWQVTVVDANTFTLSGSAGNGAYTGGGVWTRATSLQPSKDSTHDPDGEMRPQGVPLTDPLYEFEPGGQGGTHFSLVADPTNPTLVYIGGDRQDTPFPNLVGANNYSGRLFRGDAGQPAGGMWTPLTNNFADPDGPGTGVGGTSPHADSRNMRFDAGGRLIESDDGGVYARSSPTTTTGVWSGLIGNLAVTEGHSVGYDPVSQVQLSGNQDTGTSYQSAPGSLLWNQSGQGDGARVIIAVEGANSVRYISFQNQGSWRRQTVNAAGTITGTATLAARVPALGAGVTLTPDTMTDDSPQFYGPVEPHATDPVRLLYGSNNFVYESANRGDDFTRVTGDVDGVQALAYGHPLNADVIYAAANTANRFLVRESGTGLLTNRTANLPNTNSTRKIAIDPDAWQTVYRLDTANALWRSTDAGATAGNWVNLTGNLSAVVGTGRTLTVLNGGAANVVLVGGDNGVFAMSTAAPGVWWEVGHNLPNAPAYDLRNVPTRDLLSVGLLGRGGFTLSTASAVFDTTAPAVPSVGLAGPNPTNASSVTFVLTFTEPVAGLTAANVALSATGVSGAAVIGLSGAGLQWAVTVGTGTGDGSVRIDWSGPGTVVDLTGNPLAAGTVTGPTGGIDRTVPPVPTVLVGDGTPQRSRVTSVTVTFAEPVLFPSNTVANGFTLTGPSGTISITSPAPTPTQTVFVLSFTGAGVEFGSLADGRYTFVLNAGAITDPAGNAVPPPAASEFHRLFGDGNGDTTVDFDDLNQFGGTFGASAGDPSYAPQFDFNIDGTVDFDDLNQFGGRFGSTI